MAGSYRKVIRVAAAGSPNIRLAIEEQRAGLRKPDKRLIRTEARPWGHFSPEEYEAACERWTANGRPDPPLTMVLQGVKDYEEYVEDRLTWDLIQQTVSLDAQFYEGSEILMFPPAWLDRANRLHDMILDGRVAATRNGGVRRAKAIGIDPAEGGDRTAWAVVDEFGLIELVSLKTPDTSVVIPRTLALMDRYKVAEECVAFDAGGGGHEHADRMRQMGYNDVRTIAFGEAPVNELRRGVVLFQERVDQRERRRGYTSRRSEMYGELQLLLDPSGKEETEGFALPREYAAIREQLKPIPLMYDGEGKVFLPPKRRVGPVRTAGSPEAPNSKVMKTLEELIGHSPDEADALVLAVAAMQHKPTRRKAGAIG